ncbi:hypothetical protein U1Q18_051713, partial [Sarracenia purpurea var. burkii]
MELRQAEALRGEEARAKKGAAFARQYHYSASCLLFSAVAVALKKRVERLVVVAVKPIFLRRSVLSFG